MAISKTEQTKVGLTQEYKIYYERKEILGGLISWYAKVKSEKSGKDLVVVTGESYDNIIINGKTINQQ